MRRALADETRIATGKRIRRKEMTREELMLAGRQLFAEKGLYESRVEDLTRIAGIAKGTLYLYFSDKEDLIRAVVTEGFAELQQMVREHAAGGRSLRGVVSGIVGAHLEFFAQNPDLLRVFHQARGMLKFDRPRWRPLRQPLISHLEQIAERLGAVSELGRLGDEERLDLAVELFGTVSGVTSVRVAVQPRALVDTDPEDLTRALVAMFRTRARASRTMTGATRDSKGKRAPRRRQVVLGS